MKKEDVLKKYQIAYTIDIPDFMPNGKVPIHKTTIEAYSMGDLLDRIDDLESSLDGVFFEVLAIVLLSNEGGTVYNSIATNLYVLEGANNARIHS